MSFADLFDIVTQHFVNYCKRTLSRIKYEPVAAPSQTASAAAAAAAAASDSSGDEKKSDGSSS